MQNRQPPPPYLLNSSNFYPIGSNLPAQNIPLPVLVTHPLMYANAQQGASLEGGLQQRLAQVNQTLAFANQEIKQTEKRLESSTNTNTGNLYPLWVLINSHTIVDPKDYVGCEYMITKIMFNNITAQDYACVLKDTSIIVNNLGDYPPHQLELLIKREYYERNFVPRFNAIRNITDQDGRVIVNDYPSPQIAEEVTQHNRKVDNSERVYYVEVREGRKKIKQLVDPKNYKGNQNHIESISMEELASKQWYIVLKDTYMEATNLQEHNLQELRIISKITFYRHSSTRKTQEGKDNSELIYYVEVRKEGDRNKIRQLVDPKSYKDDQNDIKSISMKELGNKRWRIVSKNTYMKATNLQEHELQELIIVPVSSLAKYRKKKKAQESQSNVGTSAQQKEPTEKTVKKDEEVKRKAAPLTSPPAKKQKTISSKEVKTTTIATNVNHATNPYVLFGPNTQTVPRATSGLSKPIATPIPVSKPVTIAQEPAEEVYPSNKELRFIR